MTPTLHIVTPCLNMRDSIDRTMLSVVTQAGEFRIRYHVKDGGSTDGTVERLEWWQRRLASRAFPLQCRGLDFTFSSEPDIGMYDALIQGYAHMSPGANDWLTWINADDILMPGALAFAANVDRQFAPNQVSWFGGAVNILRDDATVTGYDRAIPTEIVRGGLCDSIHWNFVQQEGTFYRNWLWNAARPVDSIRHMKVAGDWNLWRLFAQKASFVQHLQPLAGFRIREGQLSARHRDLYHAEMDAIVPVADRRARLAELGSQGGVVRRKFTIRASDGVLRVVEENRDKLLAYHHHQVFGKYPSAKAKEVADKTLFTGDLGLDGADSLPPVEAVVTHERNIFAYDREWQFPAITEQHAFHRMRDLAQVPEGVTYVAYPWATLIDKLQCKAKDAPLHVARFRAFCKLLPRDTVKVTVCQQIYMRKYMELFAEAGIDHIFWTHATPGDAAALETGSAVPAVHPFPLYPVQVIEPRAGFGPEADATPRPWLFSFIGARANQYNPTQTRNWIIDRMGEDPRGLILGRDSWHYNRVVYDHQIRGAGGDAKSFIDQDASEQFRISLDQSVFSLCPAGTGPNSIRLWESLGAGSIPVILADSWAPPGNRKLWEAAAVFCPETPEAVAGLGDLLAGIAADPDRLVAMRQAMRQLWHLYGPQSFVHDIQKLMLRLAGPRAAPTLAASESDFLSSLVERLSHCVPLVQEDARMLLNCAAGRLLLEGKTALAEIDETTKSGQLVALAREALPSTYPAAQHFDNVLSHIRTRRTDGLRPAAPATNRGAVPRICLFGHHSNRTPLSYEPLTRLIDGRVEMVVTPDKADLIVTGFNRDLRDNAEAFGKMQKTRPEMKVLVLSEEPLWDTLWSGGFTERNRKMSEKGITIPYTFLNHENSDIFDFSKLPFFPLTTDDFPVVYRNRIGRFLDMSPEDMLRLWDKAPVRMAFFAEHRDGDGYNKSFPDQDSWGLCVYRTTVAKKVGDSGILRVGKGWNSTARRQDLPDWHLDKLAALDGRVRICSSYENTHQRHYISEKIIDVFAVGGIPTYFASPRHRVTELVAPGAMINTFGQTAEEAAQRLAEFRPDREFATAWLETAARLHRLFGDVDAVTAERRRIMEACLREVEAII